jgi:Uma2 family endonuclease
MRSRRFREEQVSERGVEGEAEFVIEILAPGDESLEKLPFYAACRISEVMIVDPWTREFDLYVLRGTSYFILKDDRGAAHSSALGVTFSLVEGPKLRVSTTSGFTDV